MLKSPLLLIIIFLVACQQGNGYPRNENSVNHPAFSKAGDIPVPDGYRRLDTGKASFGEWLRAIELKKDNHVYLYNGTLKRNQSAQFAVLDIPVGNRDLQQCADAVMRLRAEYLFSQHRYEEIVFRDNENKCYRWTKGNNRAAFDQYLENVFSWCNSASLEKQLKPVSTLQEIAPGNVFIKGGFPGHAMIVIDVAVNKEGKKVFMLAQSYMPAQDIHIVVNPLATEKSPWYEVTVKEDLITPEYIFKREQLRNWE